MRTACAFVETVDGSWKALDQSPIVPVGFAERDALIPFCARSHGAYRVLLEYFAFPDKFNFFDIDLASVCACLPAHAQDIRLHLALI